jgi:hypothetical protein
MERAFDMFNLMKLEGHKPELITYANLIFGMSLLLSVVDDGDVTLIILVVVTFSVVFLVMQ